MVASNMHKNVVETARVVPEISLQHITIIKCICLSRLIADILSFDKLNLQKQNPRGDALWLP